MLQTGEPSSPSELIVFLSSRIISGEDFGVNGGAENWIDALGDILDHQQLCFWVQVPVLIV